MASKAIRKVSQQSLQFLVVLGGAAGLMGGVYLFIVLSFGAQWVEENRLSVLTHLSYLFIISILVWYLAHAGRNSYIRPPKVIEVTEEGIILTKGEDWLAYRVVIAIFVQQNEYEKFVGSGEVFHIQQNGMVQIAISDLVNGEEIKSLAQARQNLIIRPGVRV